LIILEEVINKSNNYITKLQQIYTNYQRLMNYMQIKATSNHHTIKIKITSELMITTPNIESNYKLTTLYSIVTNTIITNLILIERVLLK